MLMEDKLQSVVYINYSMVSNDRRRIKKQWWTDELTQVWNNPPIYS